MQQEVELDSYIRFELINGFYAVPIEYVREVLDTWTLVPYPEDFLGHCGIINIRGQILPVVSLDGKHEDCKISNRLLIVEFQIGSGFGLLVRTPQKIRVGNTERQGQWVNFKGDPIQILGEKDFTQ